MKLEPKSELLERLSFFYKHPTYLTSTFVLLISDVYMNQQRLDSSNSKPITIVNFTANCKGFVLKIK